jgi:putative ATP-binding cassette transporter
VSFPAEPGTFPDAEIARVLGEVGMAAFAERLDEVSLWGQRLSGGEQQRLAFARALLHAPDWLFLDEATASLDEASEAALYRLLSERLPGVTVVSIGHRSTLAEFHGRTVRLVRDGGIHRVAVASSQAA